MTSRSVAAVTARTTAAVALLASVLWPGTAALAGGKRMTNPGRVVITGRLTNEGVECPAVRADNGQLYTLLIDDLRGLKPGDRVYIEGTKAEMSHCMQGTTLDVRVIRAAK